MYDENNFAQILVLAKDQVGYQNLLKLVSYIYIKNSSKLTCNLGRFNRK